MSLRARILLLVLLATLAPAAVLGLYLFEHRADEIAEAKSDLSSLAKYAAENLDDKVKGTVQLLHGLSRAPDLDTSDKAACSEFLAGVLARYPQYTGLLTITPDAEVHCDSLRTGRKLNVGMRDYFRQVRASLTPAFDVVIGGLTGIAVLQVAYPVLDGQGALKYVLLASLNLSEYARDFAAASRYPSTRMLIWNRTGMLMAHKPDAGGTAFVGKEFAESRLFRFAASGIPGTAAELPGLDGVSRVWALGVLPEVRGGGARITLGISSDALVAEANKALRDALAVLIGVSLLAFGGAWYVAETGIRRHVRRIANVAGRVGAGELGARIGAPYPRGEVGELMAVFDRTAGAVQAQRAEIDSRGRDLQRANRTLRVLSSINTLIVRVRERGELFRDACRIAVEAGEFPMAWIGILDRSVMRIVPAASAGKDGELLAGIKGLLSSAESSPNTMAAQAIREKQAIVSNNTENDPRAVFGNEFAASGIRALAIFPLIVADEAVGVLALYAGEIEFFQKEELRLLTELAGDISFALEHIEKEEKIERLSRIHAVTGSINALIVRVRDRQELFAGSCRIAVEGGQFPFAWIGALDPTTQEVTPVAWAGESADELTRGKSSARDDDTQRGQGAVGRAIRERRPVFNNNITAHSFGGPRLKEILRLGFQSLIALPLFEDQAVVGTLTMYAREPDFFDEEELSLLTGLAGDISFALGNISRQQKFDKLARIRSVSSEVNAAIIRIHDREALLRETFRIAVEHGKFELVWIALIDHEKQLIHPVAWAGFSSEIAHTLNWAHLGTPGVTLAEVIRTRKVAVRNDFDSEMPAGSLRLEAMKQGYRSTVCLPFVIDDSVVAAAILFATGEGFFDDDEVSLLNEMAGNISFALGHIAKEQKIARLSRIQAVTSSINALIVRVGNRQELFRESCRIAVEQGQLPFAWIGVLDRLTQDVVPVAWAGEGAEEITRTSSSARDDTPRGQGAVGRAIRQRRPVFNNDILSQSLGGPRREQILKLGFQSLIALPLLEDSAVTGTLTLYAKEPNFFDEEELRLLTELAGDISFALANISRQRKLEKLARIRAVSSEVNAAIIRIHDREALLRETCRIAAGHGKFELVWIAVIDHEKQEVRPVAWTGFSPEAAHAVGWSSISAVGGTLGRAILTRKPEVRNDIDPAQPAGNLRREALQKGCLSTVCLPLVVDDDVVALMALFAPGAGFFDDEELALLNEVAADVSFALQAIKKQEKLEYLSYYDVLTGLPNRNLFVDRLSQQMRSRGGEQQLVALIVIDVERFRNINESLGHRSGDELLNSIAQRLGHAFHGKDYLARISSNGFGAIVRGMKDAAGAAHLVENEVFSCFSQPFAVSGRELRVSVKAGIALFPVDGEHADILFRNAESALKRAKASGEHYLFYRSEMNASVAETLLLENRLRQALDKEEFVLHYQPKVDLATGTISGLEALIRWNDPQTGLVPPMKFIPLLEETGMILEAGRWAMLKAVADYREWHAQGREPPRIAVNVSPIQLRQKDFVDVVRNVIGGAAAGPHGLDLEITESLIMEDIEGNIEKLRAVRDMGVNIAIDDFGTGYSSLGYLAKLPVNALKIDRSFIITMTGSADSMTIVSTIISLAHALKLKVIAEGVDAEEQRKFLRLLKCDEMQGYLFSRPVPRDDVLALLQADSPVPA